VISSWIQQPAESRYREPSACRGCLPHPIRTPGRQVLGDCRCVVCAVVTGFYVLSTLHATRHDTTRQETGACSCYFPIGVASCSERTAGAVVTRKWTKPPRHVLYITSLALTTRAATSERTEFLKLLFHRPARFHLTCACGRTLQNFALTM
jgi:hypothetical protein